MSPERTSTFCVIHRYVQQQSYCCGQTSGCLFRTIREASCLSRTVTSIPTECTHCIAFRGVSTRRYREDTAGYFSVEAAVRVCFLPPAQHVSFVCRTAQQVCFRITNQPAVRRGKGRYSRHSYTYDQLSSTSGETAKSPIMSRRM